MWLVKNCCARRRDVVWQHVNLDGEELMSDNVKNCYWQSEELLSVKVKSSFVAREILAVWEGEKMLYGKVKSFCVAR